MLGNCVEMCLVFCRILGSLVLGWALNHFVLGTQLAPCEKGETVIISTHNSCFS